MAATFHTRRARLTHGALCLIILLAISATTACLRDSAQTNRDAAASNVNASHDANVSTETSASSTTEETRAADAALAEAINGVISGGEFASARWGICVISLRDGRTVYARDAERLFTPASVMKVYTTAAALDMLGADFRWRTSVYAATEPDRTGTISGNLILYGRGDPDLSSRGERSDFASLADELYARGVRRVRGDVVGDESHFRGEALGQGWLWEDAQWYYGAEPSALSVDGNEVTISITPAAKVGESVEVKIVPPTVELRVTNDARTVERGSRPTLGITRALSSNDVRVWGEFPAGGQGYGVRLSVQRPALRAARLFREALRARGIEVRGEARVRDARTAEEEQVEPERAVELAHVLSRTLAEVARDTNKESLNLHAELILRTLGRERGSEAPDADPRRNAARNTDTAGLAVVRRWLERAGINTEMLALHDGSGLSRLDLVTPQSTARMLAHISRLPSANAFRDSLPVAGRDGTLQGRLRNTPAAGQVFAKTGSLTYVNGLAGYTSAADGEPLAFAIFCNDKTQGQSSLRVIDSITLTLTQHPQAPGK